MLSTKESKIENVLALYFAESSLVPQGNKIKGFSFSEILQTATILY
jgi:hypothetical protein